MSVVSLKGKLKLEIVRNGEVVKTISRTNLITNAGLNLMAGLLGGQTDLPSYVAFGDDDTTPVVTDTALGNEVGTRVSVTSTVDGNVVQFEARITATEILTDLCEVGMFTAETEGILFNHTISEVFSLAVDDILNIGWTIEIGE